ncbi:MAG: regulatory protein RecX [Chitinophagales bacterium]
MIRKKLNKEQALQKLRHYCRYQERCQSEVKNKLFQLGINKGEHDEIITGLIKENFLNEERFAAAFATGRFKMKHWGRKKIQFELKEKRVNNEAIEKGLEQINEEDYMQTLRKLAKEKYASLKHEQYLIRKKKTMDYLMQKGYEAELIKTFLEKISDSSNFGK